MEKHDEPELRIIEVKGSLPAQQTRRPVPPTLHRSAPTRAEALEDLRSMKGADVVIKRLPALGNTTMWGEKAFWSVNEIRGTAFDPFFWDCDFQQRVLGGFRIPVPRFDVHTRSVGPVSG